MLNQIYIIIILLLELNGFIVKRKKMQQGQVWIEKVELKFIQNSYKVKVKVNQHYEFIELNVNSPISTIPDNNHNSSQIKGSLQFEQFIPRWDLNPTDKENQIQSFTIDFQKLDENNGQLGLGHSIGQHQSLIDQMYHASLIPSRQFSIDLGDQLGQCNSQLHLGWLDDEEFNESEIQYLLADSQPTPIWIFTMDFILFENFDQKFYQQTFVFDYQSQKLLFLQEQLDLLMLNLQNQNINCSYLNDTLLCEHTANSYQNFINYYPNITFSAQLQTFHINSYQYMNNCLDQIQNQRYYCTLQIGLSPDSHIHLGLPFLVNYKIYFDLNYAMIGIAKTKLDCDNIDQMKINLLIVLILIWSLCILSLQSFFQDKIKLIYSITMSIANFMFCGHELYLDELDDDERI